MILQFSFLLMFVGLAVRDVVYKKLVDKIAPESLILIVVVANILVGLVLYAFVFERTKVHQDVMRVMTFQYASLIILSSVVGLMFTYYYYVIITTEKLYFVNFIFSIYPIFIAIAGYYFLNQTISVNELFAMITILIGVIMLNYFKT